jgi:hypothetical protein
MGNYASWMTVVSKEDEYTIDKRILLEAVCIAGSMGLLCLADHRLGVRQAVVSSAPEDLEQCGGLITLVLTDSRVDSMDAIIPVETERLLEENRVLKSQLAGLKMLMKIPLSSV